MTAVLAGDRLCDLRVVGLQIGGGGQPGRGLHVARVGGGELALVQLACAVTGEQAQRAREIALHQRLACARRPALRQQRARALRISVVLAAIVADPRRQRLVHRKATLGELDGGLEQ